MISSNRIAVAVGCLLAFLVVVGIVWRTTFTLDSPIDLVTWSNSFMTDEAFHTKWAHNLLSFGEGIPYNDASFLPVSHFHNLLILSIFLVFGISFEVVRFYALVVGGLAVVAFYGFARQNFDRTYSVLCTVLLVSTINFIAYSRVGFIEPLAILFCALSSLAYAAPWSAKRRGFLSALAAFAAVTAKIHFLTFAVALAAVWFAEIALQYRTERRSTLRVTALGLVGGIAAGTLFYAAIVGPFWTETIAYHASGSKGVLGRESLFDVALILENESAMLRELVWNTHTPVCLAVAIGVVLAGSRRVVRILFGQDSPNAAMEWFLVYRADLLMLAWLVAGLVMIGSIVYQPARYFVFAVLPLSFLATRGVVSLSPRWTRTAMLVVLGAHLAVQAPDYWSWLSRRPLDSQYAGLKAIADTATGASSVGEIRIIGTSAEMLSLFDARIRSIYPEYFRSGETICSRIEMWSPRYAFATQSELDRMLESAAECGAELGFREIHRVHIHDGLTNEFILSELSMQYTEDPVETPLDS